MASFLECMTRLNQVLLLVVNILVAVSVCVCMCVRLVWRYTSYILWDRVMERQAGQNSKYAILFAILFLYRTLPQN